MENSIVVDFLKKKFKKSTNCVLLRKASTDRGEVKCVDRQPPNKQRPMGLLFRSQGVLWNSSNILL